MKITAVPSLANSAPAPTNYQGNTQQGNVEQYRTLQMKTNFTPLPNQQAIPDENIQPAAPVEATQPLSPQLALLAKQRRALQIRERELVNRERALSSQPTSGSAVDIAKLKSDPLSVLLENGVTYDQLTQAIMSGQGNSEINSLKAEIQSLKQGIDQKFQDKDSAAEKQVLAEIRREAEQLVKNDQFELVRETRNLPNVVKLIEKTWRATRELLSTSEACQLVEDELFKDAEKMMRFKKMQSRLGPMAQQMHPQPQQRYQGMRTLTNRDTASVPLSAKARAMAAFYGTLKR